MSKFSIKVEGADPMDDALLSPGKVLDQIPGLKREKLMFWVKQGYISTVTIEKHGRTYHNFTVKTLAVIQQAYKMIVLHGMKDKQAFDRLRNHKQMSIF